MGQHRVIQPRGRGRIANLQRLAEMVQAIERGQHWSAIDETRLGRETSKSKVVASGWPQIDRVLSSSFASGGLGRGLVHEWFGLDEQHDPPRKTQRDKSRWTAPLSVLVHLAWRALEQFQSDEGACHSREDESRGMVLWIGRRIWPHARVLVRNVTTESTEREQTFNRNLKFQISNPHSNRLSLRTFSIHNPQSKIQNPSSAFSALSAVNADRRLLHCSIFIDPPDDASRLWAIDLALRCKAIAAVIADGSGLAMAESRRLQLAAESGNALALLARPPWDLDQLSAASTRWRICRALSDSAAPRWTAQLLRCKGVQPAGPHTLKGEHPACWMMELDREKGVVSLLADVVDRPDQKAPAASIKRRSA